MPGRDKGWSWTFANVVGGDDLDAALAVLYDMQWNPTLRADRHGHALFTGDKLAFRSPDRRETEAFVRGMATALAVLDEETKDRIRRTGT